MTKTVITLAKDAGFAIYPTGGNCTAYRKEAQLYYVLITNADGTSHLLDSADDSYMVGIYSRKEDDEIALIKDITTIEAALERVAYRLRHDHIDQVLTLAREFGVKLQEALSAREMRTVIDRNKSQDNPGICHSHDFCDANMVMLEAWAEVSGLHEDDFDMDDDDSLLLWNAAWSVAKAADFFI